MNTRLCHTLVLGAALATALTLTSSSAFAASGFLAQVGVATGLVSEDQANQLDQWHAALGNPLDQIGRQINPITNGGGFQPAQPVPVQLGAFCGIPGYGRFGPGPWNPVGSPCYINGAYGQVLSGNVIQ